MSELNVNQPVETDNPRSLDDQYAMIEEAEDKDIAALTTAMNSYNEAYLELSRVISERIQIWHEMTEDVPDLAALVRDRLAQLKAGRSAFRENRRVLDVDELFPDL